MLDSLMVGAVSTLAVLAGCIFAMTLRVWLAIEEAVRVLKRVEQHLKEQKGQP